VISQTTADAAEASVSASSEGTLDRGQVVALL